MSKILKNNTDQDVELSDLAIVIPASGQRDISDISTAKLSASQDLYNALAGESPILTGNDGTNDLTAPHAWSSFTGEYQKFATDYDQKMMVKGTPRPEGQYTYFMGRGDNIATGEIGRGQDVRVSMTASNPQDHIDIFCLDGTEWAVRDGAICYSNAPKGANFSFEVICEANSVDAAGLAPVSVAGGSPPASLKYKYDAGSSNFLTTVYLVPNKDGEGWWNYDAVNGLQPANEDGTYDIYNVRIKMFRFANEIEIQGTSDIFIFIPSNDAERMYPGYFLRLVVNNGDTPADFELWGYLRVFRKNTINADEMIVTD